MKKFLLIIFFTISLIGNSYAEICDETSIIQNRNGLLFLPNQTQPYSGETLCTFENGQYKTQGEYTNGLKDGKWTSWSKNGIKKIELNYILGTLQSITIFSPLHYKKIGLINYINGVESTIIIWDYFDNGMLKKKANIKDNKLNGKFIQWYLNGNKEYQADYIDDVPQGIWWHWHENGKIEEEVRFIDGKRDGTSKQWKENGIKWEDVNYKNGKLHGLWTKWHENGQKLRDRYYDEGNKVGTETSWYPNGEIAEVGNYKLDKAVGIWTKFYPNGQKYEEGVMDGFAKIGVWTIWHENGLKLGQGAYKGGMIPSGKWTIWHENGQKKSEGTYIYDTLATPPLIGSKDGIWLYWSEDGVKTKEIFKNGILIDSINK